MESEADCSESVLPGLTSGPLWAVMDGRRSHVFLPSPRPSATPLSPSLILVPSPPPSVIHPGVMETLLSGINKAERLKETFM